MENKSHAFAAGAFVLLVSALLVALAIWLTRDSGEQTVYELSSREAVTGLQPQAGVRFKGVKVGKVVSIGFDPTLQGNVLIRIATDMDAPITRSTFATLGFQGVTGLAFVQLDDTGDSKDLLVATGPNGSAPPRIPMRPSLLSKLSDQGTTILMQLEETSRRVNQLLDPVNQKTLMGAIDHMGQAANGIQKFAYNADKLLDAQFGPQQVNIPKLVQEVGATLQVMKATSVSVGTSADEAKASAAEFRAVSQSLNKPGGLLEKLGESADALTGLEQALSSGTLPRVNRTSEDAARTARQLGRAVNAVSDNPQALIFGNGAALPGPGEAGFAAPAR
jgi:phospholipid/cholesterol/gamma-HCH transport system substrate-binding protein